MRDRASPRSSHALNFSWLVRLRWAAIAGQAATVLVVDRVMGIALPVLALLAVVGVELQKHPPGE